MSKEIDKKRCGANVEKVIIDEFVPSKELDALERGIQEFEKYLEDDCNNEWLKRVVAGMKKCYQRLEAIENAKPSEAMKCFEAIEEYGEWSEFNTSLSHDFPKEYNTIKQYILKAQEQDFNYKNIVIPFFDELVKLLGINDTDEMLNKIKEQEKVLEIIKEKSDLSALEMANDVNEFNEMTFHKKPYTQEEFDLLKRYFRNEHTPSK